MNLDSLKEQVSNITLYDLKAGVRKVQNAVMNYTEMEAKVREATNNEPWGCLTSTMQEIANGTFNYQTLNEIMPMLYKRFTDKAAEEWRQIYKSLQLLEFLIKNGSERVVDDARSHLSLIKMLKQFHYIDQNGKDQGINVRNRAKELVELLGDVERIRQERKKSRATRNKYGGVAGGAGLGMSSGGSRYGGFGNQAGEEYGTYSGRVYGDGGGFGGDTESAYPDMQGRRERFEEYDEYDEGAVAAPGKRKADTSTASASRQQKQPEAAKMEPEVDLLSVDDDEPVAPTSLSNGKQKASASAVDDFGALQSGGADDDFDEFQSATPSSSAQPSTSSNAGILTTQLASPQPRSAAQGSNINNLFALISPPPSSTSTPSNFSAFSSPIPRPQQPQQPQQPMFPQHTQKPSTYQPVQPNYFGSVSLTPTQPQQLGTPQQGGATPGTTARKPTGTAGRNASGGDAFASLWSSAGAGIKKGGTPTGKGLTLADMAKQKASAGIWGASGAQSSSSVPGQRPGGGQNGAASNNLLG